MIKQKLIFTIKIKRKNMKDIFLSFLKLGRYLLNRISKCYFLSQKLGRYHFIYFRNKFVIIINIMTKRFLLLRVFFNL